MENKSEQKSSSLSEKEEKLWDFYLSVGVQGADELRKELGLDELNFRRLAPNLNREPKKYFLYRILDEIQKASLKIVYWKEYLAEEERDKLQRIDCETIIDDQQFRARKLAEMLVDAILFSTTNNQAHFGDYFFLHELDECARSQEDRYEFFGFHNKNAEWNANWLCEEIGNLEKAGLEPKSRWYIKNGEVLNEKWGKKRVPFSSFRDRYKKILPIALPSELTVLGKSYVHAYSGMSKDVHFTPHDTSSGFREEEIREGVDRVGLLVLALIIRCQHLLGCVPKGINKRYREMHDSNTGPAELVEALKKKPAEAGDIVWVQGDYAEVLSVTTSKYGYPAYHVKYIEHSPLPEVLEDWFAGFEVRLVAKKIQIEKAADAVGEEIEQTTGQREDRARLLDCAKRAVIKLSTYQRQLRQQSPQPLSKSAGDLASKPNTPPKAD
ncbi:MAG TPA: hypothetical protein DCQ92_10335 [Verrucomicrobia subdivision 3 bacterium]|nr:hypothetical protein [Limisphaerales bacterium]